MHNLISSNFYNKSTLGRSVLNDTPNTPPSGILLHLIKILKSLKKSISIYCLLLFFICEDSDKMEQADVFMLIFMFLSSYTHNTNISLS